MCLLPGKGYKKLDEVNYIDKIEIKNFSIKNKETNIFWFNSFVTCAIKGIIEVK